MFFCEPSPVAPDLNAVDLSTVLTRRQVEAMLARLAGDGCVVTQEAAAATLGITQSAYCRRLAGAIARLQARGHDVRPIRDRLGLN